MADSRNVKFVLVPSNAAVELARGAPRHSEFGNYLFALVSQLNQIKFYFSSVWWCK